MDTWKAQEDRGTDSKKKRTGAQTKETFLGHSFGLFPCSTGICTCTPQVMAQLHVSLFAWQIGL